MVTLCQSMTDHAQGPQPWKTYLCAVHFGDNWRDGEVGRWNGRKAFVLRGIAEKSSECESSSTEVASVVGGGVAEWGWFNRQSSVG